MRAGLLIADKANSAIGSSSRGWAKELGAKILFAADFPSPKVLLNEILRLKPAWLLFSWREALFDLVDTCGSSLSFKELLNNSVLGVSIPDHLGMISPKFLAAEEKFIPVIDFLTVTSDKLRDIYSQKFPEIPVRILFDVPDETLLKQTKEEGIAREVDVIWVGNTSWGKRLGIQDHKGYEAFVAPLLTLLKKESPTIRFKKVDRARSVIEHEEVLRMIAQSRYLLQCSKSEGTGLPLLEAMALGTIPITTDVGIAPLVLGDFCSELIVENYEEARLVIESGWNPRISEAMKEKYAEHMVRVEKSVTDLRSFVTSLDQSKKEVNLKSTLFKRSSAMKIDGIWAYRYLRARIKS